MNLSKSKAYIALALMATTAFTVSCKKDDSPAPTPIGIRATLANPIDGTRAANDVMYGPDGGSIYLHYARVGSTTAAVFTCSKEKWSTAAPLFWNDLVAVSSKYPFFALAPAVPAEAPIAAADQSTIAAYTTADQLVAYTEMATQDVEIPLAFKHILAQFKVTISAAVEATDPAYIDPASATLTIGGVRTAYTISYDGTTSEKPAVATVAGDASNITPHAKAGSFYAVAPAQSFAAGALTLAFVVDGKTYTWSNEEAITSVAGMNVAIHISIQKSGISLLAGGITLTDWDNSLTLDNETVVVDGLVGGTPEAGNITLADGDVLELASNGKVGKYTYAAAAWGVTTPLYWDDMLAGASTFKALYTPAAAPVVGNELDYLIGAATDVAFGAPINLKMTHAMAQVSLVLKAGTGYANDAELLAAVESITIGMQTLRSYSLANGVVLDEAIGTIAAVVATPYIVAPQVLNSDKGIKISLNTGRTHTLDLAGLSVDGTAINALEAGKNYTINATISDKAVDAISVSLAAWNAVVTDEKELVIDGLTGGDAAAGNITPAEGDVLKLVAVGSDVEGVYDFGTTAWTSKAPIYWGRIPVAADYGFKALYTPAVAAILGNEKDYYVGGTATNVAFGAPIDLNMAHAMAQVKVVLKAGKGYIAGTVSTPAEDAALVKLLSSRAINLKKLATIDAYNTISLLDAVASITGTTPFANATSYIVAPQTLEDDNTIVLTLATGHQYSIKLNTVNVTGGGKLTALAAGHIYTITVIVTDTEADLSVSLADWNAVEGDGEAS